MNAIILLDEEPAPFENITSPRQLEILDLLVEYGSHSVIATQLGISNKTVCTHLDRARAATGIENTVRLAVEWDRWRRKREQAA